MPGTGKTDADLTRRALMTLAATATAIKPIQALAQGRTVTRLNEPGPYDMVIRGGRVIDPETGLDAVRDVGITGDRIAAISESALEGARVLEAGGQRWSRQVSSIFTRTGSNCRRHGCRRSMA